MGMVTLHSMQDSERPNRGGLHVSMREQDDAASSRAVKGQTWAGLMAGVDQLGRGGCVGDTGGRHWMETTRAELVMAGCRYVRGVRSIKQELPRCPAAGPIVAAWQERHC